MPTNRFRASIVRANKPSGKFRSSLRIVVEEQSLVEMVAVAQAAAVEPVQAVGIDL